jgi:hypothetical protein
MFKIKSFWSICSSTARAPPPALASSTNNLLRRVPVRDGAPRPRGRAASAAASASCPRGSGTPPCCSSRRTPRPRHPLPSAPACCLHGVSEYRGPPWAQGCLLDPRPRSKQEPPRPAASRGSSEDADLLKLKTKYATAWTYYNRTLSMNVNLGFLDVI